MRWLRQLPLLGAIAALGAVALLIVLEARGPGLITVAPAPSLPADTEPAAVRREAWESRPGGDAASLATELTLLVVDELGFPVAHAVAYASDSTSPTAPNRLDTLRGVSQLGESDARGRMAIAAGGRNVTPGDHACSFLRVWRAPYMPALVRAPQWGSTIRTVLKKGMAVEATFHTVSGQPVGAVEMLLSRAALPAVVPLDGNELVLPTGDYGAIHHGRADANGYLRVEGLASGKYAFVVRAPGMSLVKGPESDSLVEVPSRPLKMVLAPVLGAVLGPPPGDVIVHHRIEPLRRGQRDGRLRPETRGPHVDELRARFPGAVCFLAAPIDVEPDARLLRLGRVEVLLRDSGWVTRDDISLRPIREIVAPELLLPQGVNPSLGTVRIVVVDQAGRGCRIPSVSLLHKDVTSGHLRLAAIDVVPEVAARIPTGGYQVRLPSNVASGIRSGESLAMVEGQFIEHRIVLNEPVFPCQFRIQPEGGGKLSYAAVTVVPARGTQKVVRKYNFQHVDLHLPSGPCEIKVLAFGFQDPVGHYTIVDRGVDGPQVFDVVLPYGG